MSPHLVPSATNVMAVMRSLRPTRQPKMEARSPTTRVRIPIHNNENQNVGQPPPMCGGGMNENSTWGRDSDWWVAL